MPVKYWSEAAGNTNPEPIDLSIVTPCSVNKVEVCANTTAYAKDVAHIGNKSLSDFNSSISQTSDTSLYFSRSSFSSKASLRNLYVVKKIQDQFKFLNKLLVDYRQWFKWILNSPKLIFVKILIEDHFKNQHLVHWAAIKYI